MLRALRTCQGNCFAGFHGRSRRLGYRVKTSGRAGGSSTGFVEVLWLLSIGHIPPVVSDNVPCMKLEGVFSALLLADSLTQLSCP